MSLQGAARDVGLPVVHYIRRTVNFNDPGIATGAVLIGRVPANAFLLQTYVRVEVAFNAVTTNVLTVGTAPNFNNIAAAADITEGSLQTQVIATGAGLALTDDTDIFAKYTQTGTAATAGRATIVVGYCVGE